jgi:hypothetical protein
MLNLLLLFLSGGVGCILGRIAHNLSQGDGNSAIRTAGSVSCARALAGITLLMIGFGATGNWTVALLCAACLVAYVATRILSRS